jgi:hypothetical protein
LASTEIRVIPAATHGANEHGQTHTGVVVNNPFASVAPDAHSDA